MIANRDLTMDDYLAVLRRRWKIILIPALIAPLLGYLVSFVFAPKYKSQSLILVEGQKVPENMVQPVVSEDLSARMATLQQQVLSQSNLQPIVDRVFPGKSSAENGEIIEQIRANMEVSPVSTDLSSVGVNTKGARRPGSSPVPAFNINYTAPSPREAQQICNELTSSLLTLNQRQLSETTTATSNVLDRGIEDAKNTLDDFDSKLAAFKKQYVGQLPGDEENNLKILMGLNSQLDANTQTLNRAQQDKSYTESMLAQQLTAWKTTQSSTNPQTLEKQLSDLQTQLLNLKARYTDDHPDVAKAKADIAEVKKKLAEVNAGAKEDQGSITEASASEPPEIRQLRLQVHQYTELIAAATRDQKRLQTEIAQYQGRVSLSPAIEEQYKQLTRDYDNALKAYQDLLTKKSTNDLTIKMTNQSVGERMFALNLANLPESPSFPNRLLFAAGGLGLGLGLGMVLTLWLELRDQAIRTEADAQSVLDLPILIAVPWVGSAQAEGRYGKFWHRPKRLEEPRDSAVV